jgi:hypothetical protein
MAEKSYLQKYREGLIESIKVAGQMLIDNAEELAGKVDHMSHFDISIDFDQEKTGSIPELTVTKSFFPPEKEVYSLMDIYRNGKKECSHDCYYPMGECNICTPEECEIHGE